MALAGLFDVTVLAETFGVAEQDIAFDAGLVNPHALADAILDWCRRVVPDAKPIDHFGFAAVIIAASGWSDPWSMLDVPREKERAALRLIHGLRGRPDDADALVQLVTFDQNGRHAPPGVDLEAWTRYVIDRLIHHYFADTLPQAH